MTETWQSNSEALAVELFAFLQSIDPMRWRAELEGAARDRLRSLAERARELRAEVGEGEGLRAAERLGAAYDRLAALLESAPGPSAGEAVSAEWVAFRKRLVAAYEELRVQLKTEEVIVPSIRPTNHHRSLFHVASGLGAMALVLWVLTPFWLRAAPALFALVAWSMETARVLNPSLNEPMMRAFGKIAHETERYRVNSATWYATALTLIAFATSARACAVAVAVLALGDPAAGYVGRRWGRTKINGPKSLQGTLAFFGAGTLAGLVAAALYGHASPGAMLLFAVAGALPGALAELYTGRMDDNFSIPVAAAAGVSLAERLLG